MAEEIKKEPQYTPEQILQMRNARLAFYKGEMKFLNAEAAYEKVVADIEEHKLRGYLSMVKASQLYADTHPEENTKEDVKEDGKS